jgi:hypothetical protein
MTRDSRLMRAAPRREARLGPKGESGGANGNRPIDHSRFDCMAEYAGECWANALRAPGFHASHRTAFGVDGPSGFNPISQGGKR